MKTSLPKKICAIIIALALYTVAAYAQIVYTDVNPDKTISGSNGSYNLDLNNDGIADYLFNVTASTKVAGHCTGTKTNYHITVSPLGSNKILDGDVRHPKVLSPNVIVDLDAQNWSKNNAVQTMASSSWQCMHAPCTRCNVYLWIQTSGGTWYNVSDHYLGLKIYVGSNIYYGWVRLDIGSNASYVIIKDYAYNSIPNQPILAGETSCANPTVNLSASGTLNFCTGDSVTLTANGTGYLYQWKKDGADIRGETSQTYIAKTTGAYECKAINSCGNITSNAISITVYPSLANITASGPTIFCKGGSVMLNANTGAGLTYQWKNNGHNISGATGSAYVADTTGVYSVAVTNKKGCTSTSNAISVSILKAMISVNGQTAFCKGDSVILSSEDTGSNLSYRWTLNGVKIQGAFKSNYTAKVPGNYRLQITDNTFGCSDTSKKITVTVPCVQAPDWVWAKGAGGSDYDRANSITTDAAGNVYITGLFYGDTITFGSITLTNSGGHNGSILIEDIFIVKYNSSGDVLWAKSANGSSDYDIGSSITTDASGNVYLTGAFVSPTISFGSTTLINAGYIDCFIVKYDSSGNMLWAKSAGGSEADQANNITTDATGNVYITGSFDSDPMSFGNITLTNAGVFIAKYDSNGNVLWAKNAGGGSDGYNVGNGITTDASGNVYLTGYFNSSTISFGSITLINAGSEGDCFIVKYDFSGNVLWAKRAGGSSNDQSYGIAADAEGNAYITGEFAGPTSTFGSITLTNVSPGYWDVFIAKYGQNGNVLWAKSAGAHTYNEDISITTDATGNVYLTGDFAGPSITFGSITLTNVSPGSYDVFIARYDSNGNVLWAKSAGGSSSESSYGIAADAVGNVYLTGGFVSPTITFGSITLTNAVGSDVFIAKLGQEGTLPVGFLNFDGTFVNSQAVLTWSTVNEINNKGFDVERSSDGKSFTAIGFVEGKGNTSSISNYSFTDVKLAASTNYYRLKQIDNDGNFKYSNIIKLNAASVNATQLKVAPNPFSNSTTISFSLPQSQKVAISIFDMNGRLIKTLADAQIQAGAHQLVWNAKDEKGSAVSAGMYFLKMQTGNYVETKKIVVTK